MSKLLDQAFAAAALLPEEEQDAIATWLLQELAAEKRWQLAFEQSADVLARLADEAWKEHLEGRTDPLDPDKL